MDGQRTGFALLGWPDDNDLPEMLSPANAAAADASAAPPGAALDDDLIEVRQSDGFEIFYRQHYPAIARALSYTLYDVDLGREACDEAMARAYARWATVGEYDDPAGWVYRVGLNWARDVLRRVRRLRRTAPRTDVATSTDPPVTDPAIAAALGALDVRLRSVVVCRLLLDWSVDETATALRIKPGTVKSRLHRATAVLERELSHLR